MKKISVNVPTEIEDHIDFIGEYLKKESMINFTKTQIILYAIEKLFSECWNESIKSDT